MNCEFGIFIVIVMYNVVIVDMVDCVVWMSSGIIVE